LIKNRENYEKYQFYKYTVFLDLNVLNYNRLYKELGNLFFAIAYSDGKITPKEKECLNNEIQFSWKHFEESKDRFGSDRSFVIQYEFETMEDSFNSAEDAFKSFEFYFKENEENIDNHTRHKIYNSARHIAETVKKINAIEFNYLVRLKKLMHI